MSEPAEIKIGRPSIFSPELVNTLLDRIAAGELLIRICKEEGMPAAGTFLRWVSEPERGSQLREAYTRARHAQADFMVEDTVRIADDELDPNKARVRILARQWLAAKLNAGKYSDKLALTGHDGGPLAVHVVRYDLPAQAPGDGAKVIEHVSRETSAAAHEAQAPKQSQVVDKTGDET